jgi:Zn-dependent metalloprotease
MPPYMLDRMLESADPAIRQAAVDTLVATAKFRAERDLLSGVAFANPLGAGERTVFDCAQTRSLATAAPVRAEGDGSHADASVNRAYDGLGATSAFFRTVLGRNSIDGRGMRLDGYVHYSRRYNNAFWNGRAMVFGDGDGMLFTDFTRSVDVIAHELTHGVVDFTAALEYHGQSGALNESVADVFGSLVKQWSHQPKQNASEADWLIGADIFTPGNAADALRSLKAPGSAFDSPLFGGRDPQPRHMSEFVDLPDTEEGDWGGVHYNSGIPNHAFYLAATSIGGFAWERAGQIWYDTLRSVGARASFQDFAERTYEVAGRLFGTASTEQLAVGQAWSGVGIQIRAAAPATGATPAPIGQADTLAALVKGIETLSEQVRALSEQLGRFKVVP